MPLREPCAVYAASNSLEAHFLCGLLNDLGIEATVVEGLSQDGDMAPTIWIDRSDIERARPIFADFEQRVIERRSAQSHLDQVSPEGSLTVTCEECGEECMFPAKQYGLVQNCPRCKAYVDVGDVGFDDWNTPPDPT